MVSIFDDMTQVNEAEVQRMLPMVDEQRRKEALRYKHVFGQFTCLKSWLMLKELLNPLSITDLIMDFNEHGKPFLTHYRDVHFNLSHCKNGIAVVVDFSPVGIDIESFRKDNIALVSRTMNPTEAEWIYSSSDPVEIFTQFWTQKEAVVKLRGTGIIDDLHHVLDGEGYRLETHINREKRYAISIAFSQIP
jgi:4'-phosphopantetheinyl transferase